MVTLCWAAKGGSGTTVVTATLALESARPAMLVDLSDELPAVLGLAEPDRPGVADWLGGDGDASQLLDLSIDVDDTTWFLPHRVSHHDAANAVLAARPPIPDARWRQLAEWFDQWEADTGGDVWIDAGTGIPPRALAECIATRWLVTRACYLSLHRAARSPVRPTGVVLVAEPGRSLQARDVQRAVGAPVVARVDFDPRIARAVDAGLLLSRPPISIRRSLRKAAA